MIFRSAIDHDAGVVELPAAVLAHLTGIEVVTDVQWSRRARHDWTDYVAARLTDLES
ncbi:hypothetical protein [Amycolatopsis sp. cmx-8-4]|uniref:hypothetical protein n=1 Tax=Amycolatopsis sp. cmx-8-4 TaxID=2790947 RepID=UPI00397A2E70